MFNYYIKFSSSTSVGKLPVNVVSEEKLDVLKKYEQQKTDKLLSKYIAFCGKVLFICFIAVVWWLLIRLVLLTVAKIGCLRRQSSA